MKMEEEQLVELTVEIGGHRRDYEKEIRRVCMIEWAFREDDFSYKPSEDGKHRLLEASALGTAYGDADLDETIQRIERAVWRANGGMCHVEIKTMGVNHLPRLHTLMQSEVMSR